MLQPVDLYQVSQKCQMRHDCTYIFMSKEESINQGMQTHPARSILISLKSACHRQLLTWQQCTMQ